MADVNLRTVTTLNGGSVDVTVYEDIDNTGTANNQETISAPNGDTTTTLSTLEGGPGNAYWCDISLNAANQTSVPEIRHAEVQVPVAGSVMLLGPSAQARVSNGVLDTQ